MVLFPHAKINLGLQVTEKRHDGFHNIISGIYPISWSDILELLEADELSFKCSGLEIPGNSQHNLCIQAFELLRELYDIPPVFIHLHKVIPIGAGLGGGSSDAAFTLQGLKQLFNLPITLSEVVDLAAKLGGDCAFFIEGNPALATERGNKLTPGLPEWPSGYLVVVTPPVHVNTGEAYGLIKPKPASYDLVNALNQDPSTWPGMVVNDFEGPIMERFPIIADIKQTMVSKGAFYSSLSGSGSSVFGMFNKENNFKEWFPEDCKIWVEKL